MSCEKKLLSTREDNKESLRRIEADRETFRDVELEVDLVLENYRYEYIPEELCMVIRKFVLEKRYGRYL